MTPPTDAAAWFEFDPRDPMWKFGGKDARIRVIPAIPKKWQTNPNGHYVFCCIGSKNDDRTLSPMFLGPCSLYRDYTAKRMENAWQYSKVYPQHIGGDGKPTLEYYHWAIQGWSSRKAERYPMGK
jgi:hypothetical protein